MSADLKASYEAALFKPRYSDEVHLQWLKNFGVSSFAGLRVLDLGCGSGYISQLAQLDGAKVSVGVDIEKPKEGLREDQSFQFVEANLDREDWYQAFPEREFDMILAFDIIEHLRSPVAFLEQCRSLLSREGSLYLTTPNTQSLERLLKPRTWSGAFDPQHRILFSKYSLDFLLYKTGLKTLQLRAPMRSLRWLPRWLEPAIGGQLLAQARPDLNGSLSH